jgi:Ca-activated chloride channel family protein
LAFLIPLATTAQKVKWEQTTFNFGSVADWNSPSATFRFKNTGKQRLMFLPQKHGREVLVQYPSRAIEPGETGEITIQFYTADTGPFSHSVRVYSNASDKAETLTLRGKISNLYTNALTTCPSFGNDQPLRTSHYNVIVVVDRATGEPINGARIELMERNKRRSVSMTSPQGKSTNKVERGKYLALVSKDAYKKAEQELYFEKGSGVHVVYLDRNEPYSERELAIAIDARWVDTEHGNPRRPSTIPIGIEMSELRNEELQSTIQPASKEPEVGVLDLGINSNKQWNEVEIATSSDSRWEDLEQIKIEPEELVAPDVVVHSIVKPNVKEKPVEEFDLGINHNSQWEDVAELDTEPIIDERVEAALASAENKQESEVNQKPDSGSYPAPEPEFSKKTYRPNNILLLLDVSGSMKEEEKMVKLKKSVRRLVMMLREVDVLTIIAYNSSSWEVLPPTPVENNEEIVSLIDSLQPNGYTNGVKGMAAAYESLYEQLIQDGNNQLIIATDGKFNSSKFSEKEAIQMVKNNSDKGITLSIIGFGEDREATKLMKRLAKEGGGNLLQINKNQNPTELLTEEIKNRSRKL